MKKINNGLFKTLLLNSKKKSNDGKKIKYKETIITSLISSPISAIFSGLATFVVLLTVAHLSFEEYQKKIFCTNEIKKFDIDDFNKKDIHLLVKFCKDDLIEYKLLNEILYSSSIESQNKLATIINQLYVKNEIDEEFIHSFSDNEIFDKFNNPNYNWNNVYVDKRNNLPLIKEDLKRYLNFTSQILFREIDKVVLSNYFIILKYLDYKEGFFIGNIDSDMKLNEYISNLKKILARLRDTQIDLDNLIKVSSKEDEILKNVFISFVYKKSKNNLIDDYKFLVDYIYKTYTNTSYINGEFYKALSYSSLLSVELYELGEYELNKSELENIFIDINKIINFDLTLNLEILKAEYRIFEKNYKTELFNELFHDNFIKKNDYSFILDFFRFLVSKGEIELLSKIVMNTKNNQLKFKIFNLMMTEYQLNDNLNDYTYIKYDENITTIIKEEKDKYIKKRMIENSLIIPNLDLLYQAIDFIKDNEDSYLKELENIENEVDYRYSIFFSFARCKPKNYREQEEIKNRKVDLLLSFFNKLKNKNAKKELIYSIKSFITKDDIYIFEKVKIAIKNEKDEVLKNHLIQILVSEK